MKVKEKINFFFSITFDNWNRIRYISRRLLLIMTIFSYRIRICMHRYVESENKNKIHYKVFQMDELIPEKKNAQKFEFDSIQ